MDKGERRNAMNRTIGKKRIVTCSVLSAALLIGCHLDPDELGEAEENEAVAGTDGGSPAGALPEDGVQTDLDCKEAEIRYDYWGDGECRQGDGSYGLMFFRWYDDLSPHTFGTNAEQAKKRCEAECTRHADWCLAFEVTTREEWDAPTCGLITDLATFEGAGNTLQNNEWGGRQLIDGQAYQTLCAGDGDCTHTKWDGGRFMPREGYHCYVRNDHPCVDGSSRSVVCGISIEGQRLQTCTDGKWTDVSGCLVFNYRGEGECRQGNGEYALEFFQWYLDLSPHTFGTNAEKAHVRCRAACRQHRAWCLAIEVTTRDIWDSPTCSLITDRATFEAAGYTLQNDEWGGVQIIDGQAYQTLCGGNGDCTHTSWDGGSFSPRDGYHCSVMTEI